MRYEDKYLNRIASQHKIRPKYMAWLAALLEKIQDLEDLAAQIDTAFDLDSAVGVQLDMIGQSVGVNRLLNFEPVYASARLSDDHYRTILRARISLNQWDGTTDGIRRIWDGIFNGYTLEVVDNQDMTMTLRVYGLKSMFESVYISRGYAAPKPEGVGVNYEFILTFTVESSLYIGARLTNTRDRFEWQPKAAPEDMSVGTDVYIGGIVGSVRDAFVLSEKAPPDDQNVNGNLFAGGRVGNVCARFVLNKKDTPDDHTVNGMILMGGVIGSTQTRFTLGSRDSPASQEICGELSASGKIAALRSSFSLPCGTN